MNQTVIMAIVFSILIIGLSILLIKFWIESINENAKEEQKNLTPSKYPDGFTCTRQWRRWHFDDTHQKICVLMENMKSTLTFSFSQIKDVSVLSDMTSMQNGSPVGRAIVGGILAGGIGAIIGVGSGLSDSEACKSLKVRVTLFNDQFIDEPFEAYLLLVKPKKGVSTQKAFTSLDLSKVKHQDCRKMKKGIEMNDYQGVIDNLQNTLELPSIKMVPQIKEIKKEMMKLGFDGALMSGSGSCVFGITRNQEILNKGYEFFRKRYFFVRKSKILNKEENL